MGAPDTLAFFFICVETCYQMDYWSLVLETIVVANLLKLAVIFVFELKI